MPRSNNPGSITVGPGLASPDSVDATSLITPASGTAGLEAHIDDASAAHAASAISVDSVPDTYSEDHVEGVLDELSALVPPKPPTLGNWVSYLNVSGIPDWGVLKAYDAGLLANSVITAPDPSVPNADADIYPYYHTLPVPADNDPPFTPTAGNDPLTDTVFNYQDGTYTGGGPGNTFYGGFTRSGNIVETARIIDDPGGTTSVVLSGMLYPADRGVLALLYFPQPGTLAAFNAQAAANRCVAALLVGKGLLSGCDGEPGGIFTLGAASGSSYDPYVYPGRATGQYDLLELHTGQVGGSGPALPSPFDSADNTAGQVRQGYDILGGTTSAVAPTLGSDNRNDNNFFRYRLPYLDDYSAATGLKFTPSADRSRYFTKPAVSENPGTDLTQAGNYADFTKDYWTFQMARYRHRFDFIAGGDAGSYLLVHFKTERAFEALVVDGTAPSASDLYSANLVNWTNVEAPQNITAGGAGADASAAYHIIRAAIREDPDGVAAPTFAGGNTWTYTAGSPATMTFISGVRYFIPGGGTSWTIDSMAVEVNGLWDNTYRISDSMPPGTVGMESPNPGFLYLGMLSEDENFTIPAGTGRKAKQRVEMEISNLDATDGPFSLTSGPDPSDKADFTIGGAGIVPTGDGASPHFLRDAKIRMFVRRPLGNDSAATAVFGAEVPVGTPHTILFHTTDLSVFANPLTASAAAAGTATATKDVEERFLDEVYRYRPSFAAVSSVPTRQQLVGPGLPHPSAPIEVPVRAGHVDSGGYATGQTDYSGSSWVQQGDHLVPVNNGDAQVAGLPDRNPPLTDAVATPWPSAGVLVYPKTDFQTGHRPSVAAGDITVGNQPDYSSGFTGEQVYVRAFDVGFRAGGSPIASYGQPFFKFLVRGLLLADFAYAAPGPGSSNIAIMVKVPGLTTWMDAGRQDGSGPSKQDSFQDGAGCQLVGPDTKDTVDPVTGLVSCEVSVNVGPAANLFLTSHNEVPVLFKVILKDTAPAKLLDMSQGGASGTVDSVRGLHTIAIIQ